MAGDSVGAGALGRRRQRRPTSAEILTKSNECSLPLRRHERPVIRFVDIVVLRFHVGIMWHSRIKLSSSICFFLERLASIMWIIAPHEAQVPCERDSQSGQHCRRSLLGRHWVGGHSHATHDLRLFWVVFAVIMFSRRNNTVLNYNFIQSQYSNLYKNTGGVHPGATAQPSEGTALSAILDLACLYCNKYKFPPKSLSGPLAK